MTDKTINAARAPNKWPKPGMRYGFLVVTSKGPPDKLGHIRFWCRCDCGKRKLIRGDYLSGGRISSCGHFRRGEKLYDERLVFRCVETGECFLSSVSASRRFGIEYEAGAMLAAAKSGEAYGTDPETGESLHWERDVVRWERQTPPRVHDKRRSWKRNCKKVVLCNTGEVFPSLSAAAKAYPQTYITHISECCAGKIKSAGKDEFGDPLIWMFYDDWIGKGLDLS